MFERFIGLTYGFGFSGEGVVARAFVARFSSLAKLGAPDGVDFDNGDATFGGEPKAIIRKEDRPNGSSRMRFCIIGGRLQRHLVLAYAMTKPSVPPLQVRPASQTIEWN